MELIHGLASFFRSIGAARVTRLLQPQLICRRGWESHFFAGPFLELHSSFPLPQILPSDVLPSRPGDSLQYSLSVARLRLMQGQSLKQSRQAQYEGICTRSKPFGRSIDGYAVVARLGRGVAVSLVPAAANVSINPSSTSGFLLPRGQ